MNFVWIGKKYKKHRSKKFAKTLKNKVKLPHRNKKNTSEKGIFAQKPNSHSILNLEQTVYAEEPLAFSLHFLFQRDQNHYSSLTSKITTMCEPVLIKCSAPIKLKIFEIKKN